MASEVPEGLPREGDITGDEPEPEAYSLGLRGLFARLHPIHSGVGPPRRALCGAPISSRRQLPRCPQAALISKPSNQDPGDVTDSDVGDKR